MRAPEQSSGNNKEKNPNLQVTPAGNHLGYLVSFVDLGTQSWQYQGQMQSGWKIALTFEITDHMQEYYVGEGLKPAFTTVELTFSMGEKANLRKLLSGAWPELVDLNKAKAFEFGPHLLRTPLMINIGHNQGKNGKFYEKVLSISKPMNGTQMPPQVNNGMFYSISDNGFQSKEYTEIPKWIRKKIELSEQYNFFVAGGGVAAQWKDMHPEEYAKLQAENEASKNVQGNTGQPVSPQNYQQQNPPQQNTAVTNQNPAQGQPQAGSEFGGFGFNDDDAPF